MLALILFLLAQPAPTYHGRVHLVNEVDLLEPRLLQWINEDWSQAGIQWSIVDGRPQEVVTGGQSFLLSGQAAKTARIVAQVGSREVVVPLAPGTTALQAAEAMSQEIGSLGPAALRARTIQLQPGGVSQSLVVVSEQGRPISSLKLTESGDDSLSIVVVDNERSDCRLSLHEAAYLAVLHQDGDPGTIDVFVVKDSHIGAAEGRGMATLTLTGWPSVAFVTAPRAPLAPHYVNGRVLSHELGHLLLSSAEHACDYQNLMFRTPSFITKQLSPRQWTTARDSPLLSPTAPGAPGSRLPGSTTLPCSETGVSPSPRLCPTPSEIFTALQLKYRHLGAALAENFTASSLLAGPSLLPLPAGCADPTLSSDAIALALLAIRGSDDRAMIGRILDALPETPVADAAREFFAEYFEDRRRYTGIDSTMDRVAFVEVRMRRAYDPPSGDWARNDWLTGGHPVASWAVEEWVRLRGKSPEVVAARLAALAEERQIGQPYIDFLWEVDSGREN